MLDIRSGHNSRQEPCFTLGNRLLRILWSIVYWGFFRFSPRPFHEWRSFLLRCFGAKIGKKCHIYPGVKVWAPWNLVVEDEAGVADGVDCYSMAKITIGEKAVISQDVFLCAGSHDYEDPNFPLYAKPIHVGANAWVCARSFVHPGRTIGEGAVIGACSVVVQDMPAWMVCAGNPCQTLKPRKIRK